MKFNWFLCIFILFITSSHGQEMGVMLSWNKSKSVKKNTLANAEMLSDINPGYPASWIKQTDYIGSTITITDNDQKIESRSDTDQLSPSQKAMLSNANLWSTLDFSVQYHSQNTITKKKERKEINFSYTVMPEQVATFSEAMPFDEYLKEKMIRNLNQAHLKFPEMVSMQFTIDESGAIIKPKMTNKSNNKQIDLLLLNTIRDMPTWDPAQNQHGTKIKQIMHISVGKDIGC